VRPEQIESLLRTVYGDEDVDNANLASEEVLEKSRRVMFAFLAGIIHGEQREKLTKLYAEAHKDHAFRHFDNCAACELAMVNDKLSRPSIFATVRKEPFHGDRK